MKNRMLLIVSLAGGLMLSGGAALGQDKPAEKTSTPEMVDCLKAKTAYWDKRMTIAYQRMRKAGEPRQREQLLIAQRLWIQFRDANCLYYDLGEGSIARIEAADCLYRMTKARAEELEKEDRN